LGGKTEFDLKNGLKKQARHKTWPIATG